MRLGVATLVAALLVGTGFAIGRATTERPANPPLAPVPAEPAEAPVEPAASVITPLGRRELLSAVASAVDAYADGRVGADENAALAGRRFELAIPFGCYGPTPEGGAPLRWSYDAASETLRVSATPVVWSADSAVAALAGDRAVDAVEGFWLPRPWTSREACPPPDVRALPPPLAPEPPRTVAVAQFIEVGASRLQQRDGKPFEVTKRVASGDLDTSGGFRLVLSGRVAALAAGQPVKCYGQSAEYRPTCIVAAAIESVEIVNGRTGEALGRWDM